MELLKARSNSILTKKAAEEEAAFPPMMKVIARLWCHEVTRVFGDRIIADDGMFCLLFNKSQCCAYIYHVLYVRRFSRLHVV